MHKIVLVLMLTWVSLIGFCQDITGSLQPAKEHVWLKQLVGDWECVASFEVEPGQEPVKMKGYESVQMLGDLWAVAVGGNKDMGFEFHMTTGYDPEKKKCVATWVDSMTAHMWTYTGSLDAAGKVLTLDSDGFGPQLDGKKVKLQEKIEVKDADHRTMTRSILDEAGKLISKIVVEYTRKK